MASDSLRGLPGGLGTSAPVSGSATVGDLPHGVHRDVMETGQGGVMRIPMTLLFAIAAYLAWATTFGTPALAVTGH